MLPPAPVNKIHALVADHDGDYTGNIDKDIDLIINECRADHAATRDYADLPSLQDRRIHQRIVSKTAPNLELICPNFGRLPLERIKKTLLATTYQVLWPFRLLAFDPPLPLWRGKPSKFPFEPTTKSI